MNTNANCSHGGDVAPMGQKRQQRLGRQQSVNVMNISIAGWNFQLRYIYLPVKSNPSLRVCMARASLL